MSISAHREGPVQGERGRERVELICVFIRPPCAYCISLLLSTIRVVLGTFYTDMVWLAWFVAPSWRGETLQDLGVFWAVS